MQGCDVYARAIYGARASIIVGLLAVLGTVWSAARRHHRRLLGGWVDALLSRVADIFFGLPFVLGAIVILTAFTAPGTDPSAIEIILGRLVAGRARLAGVIRIMRSSVIAAKERDYVMAARALGAGTGRIIFRHMLPNAVGAGPGLSTIALGVFIGAEATLSFLGVGLQPPVISWGVMISDGAELRPGRAAPAALPRRVPRHRRAGFVMLGDAVRDAFDPKLR